MSDTFDTFDTGDLVRYRGELLTVACCHGSTLHPCGHPDRMIQTAECTLANRADPDTRIALLRQMAQVTATGHRPQCARERLQGDGL